MQMTRNEAIKYIKAHWRDIMRKWTGIAAQKVEGKETYICPLPNCGHGTHGDGVKELPGNPEGMKCFGCEESGDVIHFWEKAYNKSFNEAVEELAQFVGIEITKNERISSSMKPYETEIERDFSPYYGTCQKNLEDTEKYPEAEEYLKKRGISLGTAIAYGIGYDPIADPATTPAPPEGMGVKYKAKRLIIPITSNSYATRAIEDSAKYPKLYSKGSKETTKEMIIPAWIFTANYIFVTEGIFDALSINETMTPGVAAFSINSASMVNVFLKTLEKEKMKPESRFQSTIVIAMDNDSAGAAATERLINGLKQLSISWADGRAISLSYKDPNEALMKEPEEFKAAIHKITSNVTKPDGIELYINGGGLERDIANQEPPTLTGFKNFDEETGGGIFGKLYILAAPSSLGKTTFALQMACQLAHGGRDVLYFAMEQGKLELVYKCIARVSIQGNPDRPRDRTLTALEIEKNDNPNKRPIIQAAAKELAAEVGNHLSIIEWNLDATTEAIKRKIMEYIDKNPTEQKPVIIIDYLQLIQGKEINGRRQGTKETMDDAITELRKIVRAYQIPIIAISSINRANYLYPISMEAIKESGGIEYTADVILGMQLHCVSKFKNEDAPERRKKIQEAKDESPRIVDLVCLKKRGSRSYFNITYEYFPHYDYFRESEIQEDE